ncbi:hypothetical protein BDZ91DRAFT_731054 [Kalaharituber pfeilii]|nr:hypothetical protein BDZ91DRAFT_731054 [Kalaharituber pfeilii]
MACIPCLAHFSCGATRRESRHYHSEHRIVSPLLMLTFQLTTGFPSGQHVPNLGLPAEEYSHDQNEHVLYC